MSLADELLADLDEVGGEVEEEEDVQVLLKVAAVFQRQ
jgi:hypothetical protein